MGIMIPLINIHCCNRFSKRVVRWNAFVESLTLLLRIFEVAGSNLGPETGYSDWSFCSFLSPPGECHYSLLPNRFQFIIHLLPFYLTIYNLTRICRYRWPRGLRLRSAAAWLLGLRVWIPLRVWIFVYWFHMLCVGRGLCDGLITRPEESYRMSYSVWLRNLNTEEDTTQCGM
jgi:hypothetical protein